jgi:SAM-dependent methyltransferase
VRFVTLRESWEEHALDWVHWSRWPHHDHFYWRFNRPRFLELLPPPGRLTVDIGCGEGRLGRELRAIGHTVLALDASPTMARVTREHYQSQPVAVADAAQLPLADGVADLAIAFMSLQDIDDLDGAVREAARILMPGGRLCLAIVHPVNSAGSFVGEASNAEFRVEDSYLEERRVAVSVQRDGLRMTFHSVHRPLEAYARALSVAGFLVETMREPAPDEVHVRERAEAARWRRVPCFLHVRAVRR